MDIALVVVKVFGVYMVCSGLFLLLRGKTLPLLLHDFFTHRATVFLAGLVLVFMGGTIVFGGSNSGNARDAWVAVFGWLAMLKGAAYIVAPDILAAIDVKKMRKWLGLLGALIILLGLCLLFLA
ncbi:MAG: hypothetical protein V1856_03115 [Candidatus Liptonbacteria bacterium]